MAKEVKETKEVNEFVNPFEVGVNYKMFTEALNGVSVKDYCKGKLTDEQINWLIEDLKHYKQK